MGFGLSSNSTTDCVILGKDHLGTLDIYLRPAVPLSFFAEEKCRVNHLSSHHQNLRKEEHNNPKASKSNKIVKTTAKLNDSENRQQRKSTQWRAVFPKRSIKLINFYQDWQRKKRRHKLPISGMKQGISQSIPLTSKGK